MLLAVFSDTHGVVGPAIEAVRVSAPDWIVHLGDFSRDAEALQKEFPHIELRSVRGNCDMASLAPLTELFFVGPTKIFMAHGHSYGVKQGLASFQNAAWFSGAQLALFGHTHAPVCFEAGGIWFLNPGTAGAGGHNTWAQVELTESGGISCRILAL